jgi:hypothetical protein
LPSLTIDIHATGRGDRRSPSGNEAHKAYRGYFHLARLFSEQQLLAEHQNRRELQLDYHPYMSSGKIILINLVFEECGADIPEVTVALGAQRFSHSPKRH